MTDQIRVGTVHHPLSRRAANWQAVRLIAFEAARAFECRQPPVGVLVDTDAVEFPPCGRSAPPHQRGRQESGKSVDGGAVNCPAAASLVSCG